MDIKGKFTLVWTVCLVWVSVSAEVEIIRRGDSSVDRKGVSNICGKTGSTKGVLTVAQTVSSSLQKLIESAQENLLAIEGSMCSNDLKFMPLKSVDEKCTEAPSDCAGVQKELGFKANGVYRIWPRFLNRSINVYCDMSTANGGWTVIQRRGDFPKQQDFYLNMAVYQKGFGDVSRDFWIGNDVLFAMTNEKMNVLRFDLEDFDGNRRFAVYQTFIVDSRLRQYKLTVGGFSGDAGDSFSVHNGAGFSTKDTPATAGDCARTYKGAWWYTKCHSSNLNGLYLRGNTNSYANGVNWKAFRGYRYSLKLTEMKIRPLGYDGAGLKL